jgi:hypothetical protein
MMGIEIAEEKGIMRSKVKKSGEIGTVTSRA